MKGHRKKRSSKSGLPPGTPVHIGEQKLEKMSLTVLTYSEHTFHEFQTHRVEEVLPLAGTAEHVWITVQGIHHIEGLQQLGAAFALHPLVMEDIVNTDQRPKIEDYGEYLFLVMKAVSRHDAAQSLMVEQISLIVGMNFVLCFLEGKDDPFVDLRGRLRNEKGRLRKMGCDFLTYAHLDTIVDQYFPLLEQLGEDIEQLEEELIAHADRGTLRTLHVQKQEMILLRRAIWPLRDVLSHLTRGDSMLIHSSTHIYLRDVYDHTIQLIETTETYRDMLAGMMDIYLTSLSNKLNETMKVLTVIATIFNPLTFIVGVYGMNFEVMPELEWPWGYPLVMSLMLVLVIGMLWVFRKKHWI
ncbi:MAG: magnesium/cobalt transporter CorA [Nitrospirota bacterium]